MTTRKCSYLLGLLLLSACASEPTKPVIGRGSPESLVDISSDSVTLNLTNKKDFKSFKAAIADIKPSEAELKCRADDSLCARAHSLLEKHSIPMRFSEEKTGEIVLFYNKATVRDCEQHYVDNMSGSRSLNHSAFGCATAGNTVQMISNKGQIISPNIMDLPDAQKANQSYNNYLKPSNKREVKAAEWNNQ